MTARAIAVMARHPEVPGAYLDEDDPDLGWQERALCAQTDPEAFFPEKGASVREAKRVCRSCEVRTECLEYAIGNVERHGIWAGTTVRERRAIIASRYPGATLCVSCWHPLTGIVLPSGKCRACRRDTAEAQAASRTERGLAA